MHSLNDIEVLANELLNRTFTVKARGNTYNINPKIDLGYKFRWDNARRRFGCCNYGQLHISLSKPLCSINLDKIHGKVTDTILHEIAHALCIEVYGRLDGRGHGSNWISIAKQIGCDGKRCYDANLVENPTSKYILICPTCGKESKRYKKPTKSYACGECCNGVYNAEHKLIIKQNY
jgi:predicted SprT family Zn-dependent metalloprotease